MKVYNNNIKAKIRNISYGQIGYNNLKSVAKLYNNLIFYDSLRINNCILGSVEKQMERNYER